mmetsp:Transcript_7850/g.11297  ORF Transcript_7850/g.11297 Transcript_7850/m.11297 type:complete len:106 (-) Transcript_7850:218-535(-)
MLVNDKHVKLREMVLFPFPARSILISTLAPSRFNVLAPSFLQPAGNCPVLDSDWMDIDQTVCTALVSRLGDEFLEAAGNGHVNGSCFSHVDLIIGNVLVRSFDTK